MKYNIIINQQALAGTGLDIVDAAILDYLIFICNSKNKAIEHSRVDGYTWVDFESLCSNMPLLGIKSKNPISLRVGKLERVGFVKKMRKGNQRLYVKLTDAVDNLFLKEDSSIKLSSNKDSSVLVEGQLDQKAVLVEGRIKKILIKNKDNKDKEDKDLQPQAANINKVIDVFSKITQTNLFKNTAQRKAVVDLLKRHPVEDVIRVAKLALQVQGRPYAPVITTPYQLMHKWAQLAFYVKSEGLKATSKKVFVGKAGAR